MKKRYLSLAAMLLCTAASAQTYQWAKNIGSTGYDEGNSIAVDASGNVYITGFFQDTADFDQT